MSVSEQPQSSNWDEDKENFFPLQEGRLLDGKAKTDAAKPGEDPIESWMRKIKAIRQSTTSDPRTDLMPVLEQVTRLFLDDARYKGNLAYLKCWCLLADISDSPLEIFPFLKSREIGVTWALFYESWAMIQEVHRDFARADEIYQEGVSRRAHPLDRLQRSYSEFQARMIKRWKKQKSQRGAGPAAPPSERRQGLGGQLGPLNTPCTTPAARGAGRGTPAGLFGTGGIAGVSRPAPARSVTGGQGAPQGDGFVFVDAEFREGNPASTPVPRTPAAPTGSSTGTAPPRSLAFLSAPLPAGTPLAAPTETPTRRVALGVRSGAGGGLSCAATPAAAQANPLDKDPKDKPAGPAWRSLGPEGDRNKENRMLPAKWTAAEALVPPKGAAPATQPEPDDFAVFVDPDCNGGVTTTTTVAARLPALSLPNPNPNPPAAATPASSPAPTAPTAPTPVAAPCATPTPQAPSTVMTYPPVGPEAAAPRGGAMGPPSKGLFAPRRKPFGAAAPPAVSGLSSAVPAAPPPAPSAAAPSTPASASRAAAPQPSAASKAARPHGTAEAAAPGPVAPPLVLRPACGQKVDGAFMSFSWAALRQRAPGKADEHEETCFEELRASWAADRPLRPPSPPLAPPVPELASEATSAPGPGPACPAISAAESCSGPIPAPAPPTDGPAAPLAPASEEPPLPTCPQEQQETPRAARAATLPSSASPAAASPSPPGGRVGDAPPAPRTPPPAPPPFVMPPATAFSDRHLPADLPAVPVPAAAAAQQPATPTLTATSGAALLAQPSPTTRQLLEELQNFSADCPPASPTFYRALPDARLLPAAPPHGRPSLPPCEGLGAMFGSPEAPVASVASSEPPILAASEDEDQDEAAASSDPACDGCAAGGEDDGLTIHSAGVLAELDALLAAPPAVVQATAAPAPAPAPTPVSTPSAPAPLPARPSVPFCTPSPAAVCASSSSLLQDHVTPAQAPAEGPCTPAPAPLEPPMPSTPSEEAAAPLPATMATPEAATAPFLPGASPTIHTKAALQDVLSIFATATSTLPLDRHAAAAPAMPTPARGAPGDVVSTPAMWGPPASRLAGRTPATVQRVLPVPVPVPQTPPSPSSALLSGLPLRLPATAAPAEAESPLAEPGTPDAGLAGATIHTKAALDDVMRMFGGGGAAPAGPADGLSSDGAGAVPAAIAAPAAVATAAQPGGDEVDIDDVFGMKACRRQMAATPEASRPAPAPPVPTPVAALPAPTPARAAAAAPRVAPFPVASTPVRSSSFESDFAATSTPAMPPPSTVKRAPFSTKSAKMHNRDLLGSLRRPAAPQPQTPSAQQAAAPSATPSLFLTSTRMAEMLAEAQPPAPSTVATPAAPLPVSRRAAPVANPLATPFLGAELAHPMGATARVLLAEIDEADEAAVGPMTPEADEDDLFAIPVDLSLMPRSGVAGPAAAMAKEAARDEDDEQGEAVGDADGFEIPVDLSLMPPTRPGPARQQQQQQPFSAAQPPHHPTAAPAAARGYGGCDADDDEAGFDIPQDVSLMPRAAGQPPLFPGTAHPPRAPSAAAPATNPRLSLGSTLSLSPDGSSAGSTAGSPGLADVYQPAHRRQSLEDRLAAMPPHQRAGLVACPDEQGSAGAAEPEEEEGDALEL
ncbi:putative mitotic checkpoint serine/threonine-protein kinase BUB1 beta [Paratrimastix pyriformis]|uniref:Mitotic checkpoint serine/threonine-protein kinase BUB1 beta n=1 Tax=Paratrimastix pyriformis TaxID=342808 RepID=A0ABQ8UIR3_9EUKA|nr:putative mitotic checkpoint serine/threonine-protein kinase BUB1 beta [Paratrimastix pyriformis]